MKHSLMRYVWLVVVMASFAQAQDYTITNLGWLPTAPNVIPAGINNSGQVAGRAWALTKRGRIDHAFLWIKGTGIQDLGQGVASAINDSSEVTGFSYSECGNSWTSTGALIWRADGSFECLGLPAAYGNAIDRFGDVAGLWFPDNGSQGPHAFFWTRTAGVQDLGSFGGSQIDALGVNDVRQVVGGGETPEKFSHGFVWTKTDGLQDLGTLGGNSSVALGINHDGTIVGRAAVATPGEKSHAMSWTPAGGMQDLGLGNANAINKKGQIVGQAFPPFPADNYAALWTQNGVEDLNNHISAGSGWFLREATAINDAGQITVTALKENVWSRVIHALVLSPKMTTTLTSSRNPSHVGQTLSFKATVTNPIQGSPPNGESVVFTVRGEVMATVPLHNGVARFSTSSFLAGTYLVSAAYLGNTNYASATSVVLKQVINKNATHTTLLSGPNPSNLGESVTFTATVTSAGPTPTGKVWFKDGEFGIATVTLQDGVATFVKPRFLVGIHPITAEYWGDSASERSTSSVVNQVVH